jgi:2-phospho-L-lactate/phosphoenolpyruvate guanylyltransferase
VTSPDPRPNVPRIAAIIPVGTLEGAKTRLGGSLDAEERHDLVTGLLRRTVVAALAVDRLADVVVVSPDPAVLRLAAELGSRTLRQRSSGLNAGLLEARDDVVAGGAEAVLVVPVDLPFVTAAAIDDIVDSLIAPGPTVVLVTDRHATGTNALGLRPPDVIDFAFGTGSRAAHRDRAEAAAAGYVEVDGPLSMDLDTPEDLVLIESTARERLGVG